MPRPPVLLLAAALVPAACSLDTGPPTTVALAVLADHADHWSGRRVRVQGRMHGLEDPEHFWIEDDHLNRVAVEPDAEAESFVGQYVRVTGRFHYSRRDGRSIDSERIEPVEAVRRGDS